MQTRALLLDKGIQSGLQRGVDLAPRRVLQSQAFQLLGQFAEQEGVQPRYV